MFPILYESITPGTVPQHNGLGVLSDCITCEVEAERNGIYELTMEYPANGLHAEDIALRRIIKAKPNFTDDPQLFRIDRIGKTLNGVFTVFAKHISYDLSGYPILSGTANNAAGACLLFTNATKSGGEQSSPDFTIETDKEVTADFSIREPGSVKSWFIGREGSFLDIFGTAELKYNNFHVDLKLHAGKVTPDVTIRYGKNLLELSQESDASNLYTHVICYYKGEVENDGVSTEIVVTGDRVATGLTLDAPKVFVYDVSQEYQEPPTAAALTQRAQQYINENTLTVPSDNITLDFVQSEKLSETVNLCDNVSVYYEALGITRAQVKCIRTKWDVLRERYIETEFGDVKQNLADTISGNNAAIADNAANISNAYKNSKQYTDTVKDIADSKRRIFVEEPTPPYDVGDLWIDGTNIRYCAEPKAAGESYELSDWLNASDYVETSEMEEAIKRTAQLITGGLGGNVIIMRRVDADGNPTTPYEIVIADNPDLSQAVHVWRWNENGLAYSNGGYSNPNSYVNAITKDGINATLITTGTLNASLVKVMNLTAAMFAGKEIDLGGSQNPDGVLKILDGSNTPIVVMDANGMECFGATVNNVTPSVVFNKEGMTGYSNSDPAAKPTSKLFWTQEESFNMKNGIVENQMSVGQKLKMVPFTIRDSNNNIISDGIAEVPAI